ncbi:hypothetical protein L484_009027 [Morus notabilis]|uniref:Uncharacterized protein n=1 Tax=Morus notabilis TaxID=981085 RepID=W9RHM6_9ROSA|nr:hypothetical protein L484_009027 [Morus notabilis]
MYPRKEETAIRGNAPVRRHDTCWEFGSSSGRILIALAIRAAYCNCHVLVGKKCIMGEAQYSLWPKFGI